MDVEGKRGGRGRPPRKVKGREVVVGVSEKRGQDWR